MAMTATEPFPQLNARDHITLIPALSTIDTQNRPRRKSSNLGEITVGDTGAPGFATMDVSPISPITFKAQLEKEKKKPFSKRRKAKTLYKRWKNYALRNTWVTPLVLLVTFLILFAINPTESNPIHHFIFLSYRIPHEPGAPAGTPYKYGKGLWDIALVTFYTILLTFTREFIMQRILRPMAISYGLKSRAKQSRFMEQMYTAIYFGVMGPAGMYVMSRTPVWYFNIRGMYEDFPHKTLEADFKFYYLFQGAYWAQQAIVLVLGMEKPRKDFKELVGHHIVSLALIAASYRFHFTYMGVAVYVTHDISDFFLATSKTLNYIDHPLVEPYFVFFIGVWIYLRHYINLKILLSEFNEFKTVGPYVIVWETEQYKGPLSHYISTVLLASLQALNLFWLWAILRIAYRFVFHNALADDRSDDEGEVEEDTKHTEDENAVEVVINGKATGAQISTNEATKRKVAT